MNSEQQLIVSRLQDNLFTLRQLAGWTSEEFGNRLDVTRQTVYNLERGKPKMSWVQYLAIRKLFEIEIEEHPDNEALSQAIVVLLDEEGMADDDYKELQIALKTIAKGMTRSPSRDVGLKLALQTVGAATAGIAAGILSKSPGAGITTWLSLTKVFNSEKGEDNEW